MQISALARRSGLSVDTIRFYEKKGLINSDLMCRQKNNYRDYSEASLEVTIQGVLLGTGNREGGI
jgi:MerR family transcriptional regulator, copper efflux regulator